MRKRFWNHGKTKGRTHTRGGAECGGVECARPGRGGAECANAKCAGPARTDVVENLPADPQNPYHRLFTSGHSFDELVRRKREADPPSIFGTPKK